jgi:hypothetical protein
MSLSLRITVRGDADAIAQTAWWRSLVAHGHGPHPTNWEQL